jgi:hypothetical protein
MMNVEQSVEWELTREAELLGGNLSRFHFVTTNPTSPDLGSNPVPRSGKPATNRLSYGTALIGLKSVKSTSFWNEMICFW